MVEIAVADVHVGWDQCVTVLLTPVDEMNKLLALSRGAYVLRDGTLGVFVFAGRSKRALVVLVAVTLNRDDVALETKLMDDSIDCSRRKSVYAFAAGAFGWSIGSSSSHVGEQLEK